ncbi:hypothetical protein [Halocalculus aciditolerans]|uniref:Uncharacterized protein n=1 Tax=Halocalculus aciditolerans TaxID=1383812 RepID=A0A830FC91_9EURY|nr:hypothetical protein [Halocalculus aciditolerans]GGL60152.1 hypothetical protein GCM10009039_18000 [Halocalculus aciditolerans]
MSEPTYPRDSSALRRELRDVIRGAYENGVAVEGSYDIRFDDSIPDYDATLLEVTKPTMNADDESESLAD